MNSNETYAIGLMSGTSLDGLDLVHVKFTHHDSYGFDILSQETVNYSDEWRVKLQRAIRLNDDELNDLDSTYGIFLGEQVNNFIQKHQIQNLDFVASHGHTIFHQPDKGITKQIGRGQQIADVTQHKVICDFRTQDVQYGGQGAPFVPIGDRLLFSEYDSCVNLGGFANISYEKYGQRIAFDICPVNVVLNHFSEQMGFEYDAGGKLSSQGNIHPEVLHQLNALSYYAQTAPKSLGIEWVHECVFPIISKIETVPNALRTFTEHIAIQLTNSIKGSQKVLFSGGGVFNSFLMDRIQEMSTANVVIPDQTIINYKEALIFAFLGLLKLENKVNCLASVTGAHKDHSSGKIFTPN
jgi:anhydro-N-acetylmuramic acid kinase